MAAIGTGADTGGSTDTVGVGPGVRRARRRPAGPPVRRLTVLYDPNCRLCAFATGWLARQRQLVPLDLVPVGSPEALRRFPALDHRATRKEITVVGDGGQVYLGDSAWIVCLWALAQHRPLSHTLTSPAGRRLARATVLRAAKYRESQQARGPRQSAQAPQPGHGAARQPPLPRHGAPLAGARRRPAPSSVAPRWVYAGSGGWRQADSEPPAPASPAHGGAPPGWTYDPVTGWTQSDTAAPPDDCADGCSPQH